MHWRERHTKPFNYAYWRKQNTGYYQMQFALRDSREAPTAIQQAVLDAEQAYSTGYPGWRVELSANVYAIITTTYDDARDPSDDDPTFSRNPVCADCVYYTERQIHEMNYRFKSAGYLHIPYGSATDMRGYYSRRGVARHDADVLSRQWLRQQLDQALCVNDNPDYDYMVVIVTVYVFDQKVGSDALGGVYVKDTEDIIDAVIEHQMVESALADARTNLNARIHEAPVMFKAVAAL